MAENGEGSKSSSSRNNHNNTKINSRFSSSSEHSLKKRPPQKPLIADNVLYVSTKTREKALVKKCNDLIANGNTEIVLFCLGAAIQRGILVALEIAEKNVAFTISTNTLTTELIDDLEPSTDEADYEMQKRQNSALRIILTRSDLLQTITT